MKNSKINDNLESDNEHQSIPKLGFQMTSTSFCNGVDQHVGTMQFYLIVGKSGGEL